jgi:hypothetical protein
MRQILASQILAALILCPLPAMADPLQTLDPLLEVFSATHDTPGWDVAGIRCAGLFYAQESWRQEHGGSGPGKKTLAKAATGLEQAVQHRVNEGKSLTRATLSVEEDLHRVHALYLARFAANDVVGHPWTGDAVVKGDLGYCKAALG